MFSKYKYVYAVYQEGNFTRAAESLFISQPSLSAAIKNIEKEVGAPLFDRGGGAARLTEIGREYIAAAKKIMSAEHDFLNRIHDIYELETGSISVGGTNYLCSYVLPRIINRFTALHPKVEVSLVEAQSKTLMEQIDSEKLDIMIDSFDENMDMYEGDPLVSEKILLCLPADRPINRKLESFRIYPDDIYNGSVDISSIPAVPIEVFKDEPFILLKNGNDMYYRAKMIFEKNDIVPNVVFSVDQMNISYALADSGMGACFATDTLFRYGKFNNNVLLYNVSQEHGSRMLYIAHKRNRYCTRTMHEFIRVAKEVIQK